MFFGMLLASTVLNSCNNNTDTNRNDDMNSPDHVKENSGTEITPQAKLDSDSTRIEVDTISSTEDANDGGN